jgi:hypothetical protein
VFYAVAGIGAAVLTVTAFGLALTRSTPETVRVLLGAGAGCRCCAARPPAGLRP